MKPLKQAAVVMGWFLIADLTAVLLFEGGVFFGKTGWGMTGIITASSGWVIFWLGRLYERHLEAIEPNP